MKKNIEKKFNFIKKVLFLSWFFGSFVGIIYFASKGKGNISISFFAQIFIVIDFASFISSNEIKIGKKLLELYPAII